jgi:hypothetical protein
VRVRVCQGETARADSRPVAVGMRGPVHVCVCVLHMCGERPLLRGRERGARRNRGGHRG